MGTTDKERRKPTTWTALVAALFALLMGGIWCIRAAGQAGTIPVEQARKELARIDAELAPEIERALASDSKLRRAERAYQEALEKALQRIAPDKKDLIAKRAELRATVDASIPRQTDWKEVLWIAVGLLGQGCFTARFLVQWIVSERERRSVIPLGFWYLSLAGGMILLSYAIYRRDPVFILGQSTGVFVYSRNLVLIARQRSKAYADKTS